MVQTCYLGEHASEYQAYLENLTSGEFVAMWQQRVEELYLRYSEEAAEKKRGG